MHDIRSSEYNRVLVFVNLNCDMCLTLILLLIEFDYFDTLTEPLRSINQEQNKRHIYSSFKVILKKKIIIKYATYIPKIITDPTTFYFCSLTSLKLKL